MDPTIKELIGRVRTATLQNQGMTLTPKDTRLLEDLNKEILPSRWSGDYGDGDNHFKTVFGQVSERAAEADKEGKGNIRITAEQVKILSTCFEDLMDLIRRNYEACSNKASWDRPDVVALLSYNRKTTLRDVNENLKAPSKLLVAALHQVVLDLAASAVKRQGLVVKCTSVGSFYNFFHYHEKMGSIPPLASTTDPLHPRLTAMEKFLSGSQARITPKIHLDSEEVLCLDKILGQLWERLSDPKFTTKATKQVPDFTSPDTGGQWVKFDLLIPDSLNENVKVSSAPTQARGKSPQTQNIQAKPNQPKAIKPTPAIDAIDDRMKALAMKYFPGVVLSVLKDEQPVVARWIDHIGNALKTLTEGQRKAMQQLEDLKSMTDKERKTLIKENRKTTRELQDLKSMMLDQEQEYERLLEESKKECEAIKEESEQKLATLERQVNHERELRTANEGVNSKASEDEEKYKKQLQEQSRSYSKLKKDTDEQIAKLQSDLQDANNKIEKAQTASKKREAQWTSKLQSSTKELTDWKHKFDAEVDKNNVVQLDYEATLEEISTMKAELSKSKERDEKRDEKYVALENELAALRSSRTNPQVEKDNIARAVRIATADKQTQVEKLQRALAKAQAEVKDMHATQKTQAEVYNQAEATAMDKDASIALLKKNLAAMEVVFSKANEDLEAARRPDPRILRELDEERMENKHLKDKLKAIADLSRD